jgi:FkbM family methyltransferase
MKRVIKRSSNCIDIGCHKGKVLDQIISLAPEGRHWAFEPLPDLYAALCSKYTRRNITILPYALSNAAGSAVFKHVKSAPGYSGFRRRTYHIPFPQVEDIMVSKEKLDTLISPDIKIDFIKMDVEGAESEVFAGAAETILRNKPVIIFEHGIGAAPHYGTKPDEVFNHITNCNMQISTLHGWLRGNPPLNQAEFSRQFYKDLNYYFIAHG